MKTFLELSRKTFEKIKNDESMSTVGKMAEYNNLIADMEDKYSFVNLNDDGIYYQVEPDNELLGSYFYDEIDISEHYIFASEEPDEKLKEAIKSLYFDIFGEMELNKELFKTQDFIVD